MIRSSRCAVSSVVRLFGVSAIPKRNQSTSRLPVLNVRSLKEFLASNQTPNQPEIDPLKQLGGLKFFIETYGGGAIFFDTN